MRSIGNVTTYSDTSVQPSTSYSYTVTARDAAGNPSPSSNVASVTTPVPPPSLTFTPTDDTYIQASSPNTTAGSATTIQVDNSPVKDILLKFNVTGLSGRQVLGATLRIHNTDPSPKGGDFHTTATSSWSESTATWDNVPAANAETIASLGSVAAGSWYEVDLSSIVSGDSVVSLRVTSTSSDGANYDSKENVSGEAAQLIVSYSLDTRRPALRPISARPQLRRPGSISAGPRRPMTWA